MTPGNGAIHKFSSLILEGKPVPPGDVRRTWADLTRARDLLGYEPRTSLEDGLKQFVEWLT